MRTNNPNSIRAITYKALGFIQWGAGIASAGVAASSRADAAKVGKLSGVAAEVLMWVQAWAWMTSPCLLIVVALLVWLRSALGPPWTWQAIHDVLDQLQELVFSDRTANEGPHDNRVTLFKHRSCIFRNYWFRGGGWLVAVERSGHTTRRRKAVFAATDNPNEAEGVAGTTWLRNAILSVNELPDLAVCRTPKHTDIDNYANKTWVKRAWVEKAIREKRDLARSICGIPVEVKGTLWGVLVIDSRRTTIEGAYETYSLVSRVLGKLLERA